MYSCASSRACCMTDVSEGVRTASSPPPIPCKMGQRIHENIVEADTSPHPRSPARSDRRPRWSAASASATHALCLRAGKHACFLLIAEKHHVRARQALTPCAIACRRAHDRRAACFQTLAHRFARAILPYDEHDAFRQIIEDELCEVKSGNGPALRQCLLIAARAACSENFTADATRRFVHAPAYAANYGKRRTRRASLRQAKNPSRKTCRIRLRHERRAMRRRSLRRHTNTP